MSEDLSAVEDDEAAEEREMEQLMAAQQKEAADMQRRHTQQMQEKREALRRQKLERKSERAGRVARDRKRVVDEFPRLGRPREARDLPWTAWRTRARSPPPPLDRETAHRQGVARAAGAAGAGPDTTGIASPGVRRWGSRGRTVGRTHQRPRRTAHQPLLHHQQQTQQQPQQPHLAREQPPTQPARERERAAAASVAVPLARAADAPDAGAAAGER